MNVEISHILTLCGGFFGVIAFVAIWLRNDYKTKQTAICNRQDELDETFRKQETKVHELEVLVRGEYLKRSEAQDWVELLTQELRRFSEKQDQMLEQITALKVDVASLKGR